MDIRQTFLRVSWHRLRLRSISISRVFLEFANNSAEATRMGNDSTNSPGVALSVLEKIVTKVNRLKRRPIFIESISKRFASLFIVFIVLVQWIKLDRWALNSKKSYACISRRCFLFCFRTRPSTDTISIVTNRFYLQTILSCLFVREDS